MDYFPPGIEFPHLIPVPEGSSQSDDAYDSSRSVDHHLTTHAFQFQFHLTSPYDVSKTYNASWGTQAWWNGQNFAVLQSLGPDDNLPMTWNNTVSTISGPQSPESSDGSLPSMSFMASPHCLTDDSSINADGHGQADYSPVDSHIEVDPSLLLVDAHLNRRVSLQDHLRSVSESQCSRHGTPEQRPFSLPDNSTALCAPQKKSKGRSTSRARVRKPAEHRTPSTATRNSRRRGAVSIVHGEKRTPRVFICSFAPYGCESTFVSKNEWKRHVISQHLQLGFYRCDVGKCNKHNQATPSDNIFPPSASLKPPCAVQPNDFNRKDLFTQHQRRMHAPWLQSGRRRAPTESENAAFEASLEDVRQRCWHGLRTLPQRSHCGFCGKAFSGEGSWEARMEHVGRHFERDDPQQLGHEEEDLALRAWGLGEGILIFEDGGRVRLASRIGG